MIHVTFVNILSFCLFICQQINDKFVFIVMQFIFIMDTCLPIIIHCVRMYLKVNKNKSKILENGITGQARIINLVNTYTKINKIYVYHLTMNIRNVRGEEYSMENKDIYS